MRSLVDLHIHSRYSDGIFSPKQLVGMAAEKNLRAVALADHDTVDGIKEALEAAGAMGMEVIPAVELSVEFKSYHDVHLLGYYIDYRDSSFLEKLAIFRKRRDERGLAIVEKINDRLRWEGREGIGYEEVAASAEGALGRPHIARVLIGKGYAGSMQDAFVKYLIPCDVPKLYFPIAEALGEINRIGGIAVLAHPTSITDNRKELQSVITELVGLGLEGVEVYNNLCMNDDMHFLRNLSEKLNLLMTGGSDFHGSEPDIELGSGRGGLAVDYSLVEMLKEHRLKRS